MDLLFYNIKAFFKLILLGVIMILWLCLKKKKKKKPLPIIETSWNIFQ